MSIETIKHGGLTIELFQDEDAQSPADWMDNGAFLVHYHRDFWQENEDVLAESDLRDIYQGNKTDETRKLKKEYHIFPVSALIHSGVWLKLGHNGFAADSGGWDTSHVGAVFVSKGEFKTEAKAIKYAAGLVKTWNEYISGEVYGYTIKDESGNDLDSSWGFYGFEYAKEEAIAAAKCHAEDIRKKKQSRVKAFIKNHVPLEKRVLMEVK